MFDGFWGWALGTVSTAGVLGFVLWLMRSWIITRLTKSIEHEYQVDLEKHKSKLKHASDQELIRLQARANAEIETLKGRLAPYLDQQFKTYNNLWVSLCDLRTSMNTLWDSATEENLKRFSAQLQRTITQLEQSALLVEQGHYEKLLSLLQVFSHYELGKHTLIDLQDAMESTPGLAPHINGLIELNGGNRRLLNDAMYELMTHMRSQLRGIDVTDTNTSAAGDGL